MVTVFGNLCGLGTIVAGWNDVVCARAWVMDDVLGNNRLYVQCWYNITCNYYNRLRMR